MNTFLNFFGQKFRELYEIIFEKYKYFDETQNRRRIEENKKMDI
jgi:hypothetical protein